MGEALEGTVAIDWEKALNEAQARKIAIEKPGPVTWDYLHDLMHRIERLEQEQNPLAAFGESDELIAMRSGYSLVVQENTRLMAENHQLREALADVHRNAEAVVLLSKLAMGEER